jgi:hypothetical protein
MLQAGCGMLGGCWPPIPDTAAPGAVRPGPSGGFVSYRDKVIDTVLGPVHPHACLVPLRGLQARASRRATPSWAWRARPCRRGWRVMTTRRCGAGPFAGASACLEDLAGVRLTAKRVERAAEASGTAAACRRPGPAALITARTLVPFPPSPLPDKLYAAIDGTGVPVTAKETAGRDGKGEDGRARTREVKLAVFFTQDKLDSKGYPVRDQDSSSYVATFEPAAMFAAWSRQKASAAAPSTSASSPSSATAPPGSGTPPRSKFPEATQIVDLFHAREHLHDLARLLEFMLWTARTNGSPPASTTSTTATSTESAGRPRLPPRRHQEDELDTPWATSRTTPPHALPLVPPVRPVRRLRRRRSRLQRRHRPAPQTVRHALDRRRRRRHHHAALPAGQQARKTGSGTSTHNQTPAA